MITLDVRTNISATVARLNRLQREQVPFAASVAINNTATDLQGALSDAARAKLTAKPFTTGRGALFVQRSNKRHLTAVVGYKRIQARYMRWQLAGGRRSSKGFEAALRSLGALPSGWVTVPGAGIRLDSYGNIPRRVLKELIGQLRTRRGTFQGRGKRMSLRAPFVVMPGSRDKRSAHLAPGIWQRIDDLEGSGTIKPMILYVSGADYRSRIDLPKIAKETVRAKFGPHFHAALARAFATAR